MYCPACGEDAQEANFCPECGADLRGLASEPACEACGGELPDGAKYCPECGEAAGPATTAGASATADPGSPGRVAGGGRRTGTRGRSAGAGRARQRRQEERPPAQRRQEPALPKTGAGARRISPALIWGGFGLLAVVVVLIVALSTVGEEPTGAGAPSGAQSVQPVSADTSGGYAQLVQRANGLYDQGAAAFASEQWDQGAAYFAAAAEVYAAAWKQKATDPNVGTDFATSLFYSGETDKAIAQVEKVLAKSPGFQMGWFNKGNYLTERARHAEQQDDAAGAEAAYDDAREAFRKAVALGAGTTSGQQAQQRLDELPQ